jgi:hypothetical protein
MTIPRQRVHIATETPRSTRHSDRRCPPGSLGGDRAAFAAIATLLIRRASVVSASGALFDGMPGQTLLFEP